MATSRVKPRNPRWERDELILALDLYLRRGLISHDHPSVLDLSRALSALSLHPDRPDPARFRNANGVYLKLANFASLDPGHPGQAMSHGGQLTREVWEEFHGDRARLRQLAAKIREAARDLQAAPALLADDDVSAAEGRVLYRYHRATERNARLARRKKDRTLRTRGKLACDVCGFDFAQRYGAHGNRFIECHHVLPFEHNPGPRRTRIEDLALVCANCHRMLHRGSPRPTINELRDLLK